MALAPGDSITLHGHHEYGGVFFRQPLLVDLETCLDVVLLQLGLSEDLVQLVQQTLQCRPAFKVKGFGGIFIKGRTMVLGIIDIQADLEYVLFHRRLRLSRGQVVPSTFKVCIYDDRPRSS